MVICLLFLIGPFYPIRVISASNVPIHTRGLKKIVIRISMLTSLVILLVKFFRVMNRQMKRTMLPGCSRTRASSYCQQ
ncbi:hypothetical protein DFH27DRAFT_544179 [Peziza echinospora]|nr:hypothetical protein DFH27DRAFT_544179 [Peziza echinospora]